MNESLNSRTRDFLIDVTRQPRSEDPRSSTEENYLSLLRQILDHGHSRDDRTNTGTISLFGQSLRYNISEQLPLLTTKKMNLRNIFEELMWFLRGQTDSKILENKGINIWKGNTNRVFLDKNNLSHYDEGDIGPMYGFNLHHYGATYQGCKSNYDNQGIDQIENVIHQLKTDPMSRRIIMTTYNPICAKEGVLYPCHGLVIQFCNDGRNNLTCLMTQRSADCFLGLPYNIASYAILTHIIAKKCNMKAKELVLQLNDCHIYLNHVEQVKLQLNRTCYPFPSFSLKENVIEKKIEDVEYDDMILGEYKHHPFIKAPMNA